jgi:uncharacterized membrane-anchored protein YitT (DUF2179 family)
VFFWNIEGLKRELRHGPVPQPAAVGYILVTLLLYDAAAAMPGAWNVGREQATGRDWIFYVLGLVTLGIGIYAAYRANGGVQGHDFAARFFALGWVVSIRLMALVIVPAFVVYAIISNIITGGARGGSAASERLVWGQAALAFLLSYVLFVVRLLAHFRDIAIAPAGAPDDRPTALAS